MKGRGIAEVADHFAAVDVGFEEPELHPIERRDQRRRIDSRERAIVHHRRGLRREDAPAVELAVLQMGQHEPRHVDARRGQRTGRRRTDDLEIARGLAGFRVSGRHLRCQCRRQRLAEGRIAHTQRREDLPLDVLLERHTGHARDDVAGERCCPVRIGWRRAGRIDSLGRPCLQEIAERYDLLRIVKQD